MFTSFEDGCVTTMQGYALGGVPV